jgi:DNA-binding NarL/FixJ family response regulator
MLVEHMSTRPTPITPTVPVFLAAAHTSVRRALWALLENEPGIEPLAELAGIADLRRLLERVTPRVVIVDEAMLGPDGIAALPELIEEAPGAAYIVVGMGDHPMYITRAREAGAADYVRLDEAERLGNSVFEASGSSAPLTTARRRAGSRAMTVVPASGADDTPNSPPSSSTRSRMPRSPNPSAVSSGSKPRPASSIRTVT